MGRGRRVRKGGDALALACRPRGGARRAGRGTGTARRKGRKAEKPRSGTTGLSAPLRRAHAPLPKALLANAAVSPKAESAALRATCGDRAAAAASAAAANTESATAASSAMPASDARRRGGGEVRCGSTCRQSRAWTTTRDGSARHPGLRARGSEERGVADRRRAALDARRAARRARHARFEARRARHAPRGAPPARPPPFLPLLLLFPSVSVVPPCRGRSGRAALAARPATHRARDAFRRTSRGRAAVRALRSRGASRKI